MWWAIACINAQIANEEPVTKKQSLLVGGIAALVLIALGALLVAHLAGSNSSKAIVSVHQSPAYCDGSGDNQPGDDCVRIKLASSVAHPKFAGGAPYHLQLVTHPGLRAKPMIAEVQYRSVSKNGKVGLWWVHKRVLLSSGSETTVVHNLSACAPTTPGTYQVRAAVWVGNSRVSSKASTSSLVRNATPATLTSFEGHATLAAAPSSSTITSGDIVTSATTTLTSTSGSPSCEFPQENAQNVEYFNEIQFQSEIQVVVTDTGSAFQLQITCPTPISSTMPNPSFEVAMMTSSGSATTSCATNAAPIVIEKQTLQQQAFCKQASTCEFIIDGMDSQTQDIYSSTIVQIAMTPGDQTYIPNLDPATLPICPGNINPCVQNGMCPLGSKSESISLCESTQGSSCTQPPSSNQYSLNSNIYFQVVINGQKA